jgi:trehalose 6-phosphate phosphatase
MGRELAVAMEMRVNGIEVSALDHWDDIIERLLSGDPLVFLDYDGTLTPIVEIPSKAVLSDSMRGTLHRLAKNSPVSLMSGRDLTDIRRKIGLNELIYVGSHGFEVIGPWGNYVEDHCERFYNSLDRAENELRYAIGEVCGAIVERKRFAVAVHYCLVDSSNLQRLNTIFDRVAGHHPDLRTIREKRVLELRPNMDWDKGKAVHLVIDMLGLRSTAVPLYIGDDVTDEDAFTAIGEKGVTIRVDDNERESAAQYILTDILEVQQFLEQLIDTLEERE